MSEVVEPEDDSQKEVTEGKPAAAEPAKQETPKAGVHKNIWTWIAGHKKVSIPAAVVVVLAVLAAVPFTRYLLAGLALSKNVTVVVTDTQTHKPVTSANVALGGKTARTDSAGRAVIHARVGNATLSISKTYYRTATSQVLVPIMSQKQPYSVMLVATGRQVPIAVVNKLSGKPVANAVFAAAGTQVKTDAKGEASIVVPASSTSFAATITLAGYNTMAVTLKVTANTDPANTFQVTPAGKVYFLSNQSGKIDVVKTDLDGGNRQVVLPGSGSEDLGNTILLASRDWKYLALLSKRDGGDNAKLFLIDTSNDQTTNIDEGNASFTPIGWYDDSFVYLVNRTSYSSWQPKATSTKSFDAANKRLLVLDNTNATGSSNADAQYENIFAYSFAKDQLVYAKTWYRYPGYTDVAGQQNTLNTIKADGSDKKTLKSVDAATQYFGSLQLTKPNNLEVQVSTNGGGPTTYFTYDGTSLSPDTTLTDNTFYNTNVITYLLSPSEKQTFWSEPRDGKNTLFVGDVNGAGAKQVVAQSDYQTFGWYTDNYLLLSKGGSELYILPVDGSGTPLKISNYYKPERLFNGYGGGYGGL